MLRNAILLAPAPKITENYIAGIGDMRCIYMGSSGPNVSCRHVSEDALNIHAILISNIRHTTEPDSGYKQLSSECDISRASKLWGVLTP